jgi:gamma-glutamyltranspeptidase/glutathione hydrolase
VIAPPVNARAWEELSRTYGNKPWKSLFDAAVRIAEEGFVLDSSIPERVFAEFPEHAKAVYGSGGKPLQKGATLVQRDLARSLRAVASKGAGELHGGELGRKVAAELARAGSFVTLDDISTSRPEWGEPISIDYRGYRVTTAPPAANSFAALIRLGIVSQWDMRKVGEDGTEYWHRWAEALKHGEYCRLRYAADPAFATVPLARLLTAEYWREQAARVDAVKASDFTPPGVGERESANTTHFAVADKRGNVVTMTQTIGNTFGSRIMAPGTGIWLNDSLFYSTWEPRGNPMDVHAGRRKLNSNTPTIVLKDGRPWIAIGAAGGHTIPQTVPLTVAQMIDLDKDIERALAAPRISFVAESKTLSVEPRLPESIRKDLASRGHDIRVAEIGRLHGLTIEWDADGRPRRFTGAADPRGQGLAKGPK